MVSFINIRKCVIFKENSIWWIKIFFLNKIMPLTFKHVEDTYIYIELNLMNNELIIWLKITGVKLKIEE